MRAKPDRFLTGAARNSLSTRVVRRLMFQGQAAGRELVVSAAKQVFTSDDYTNAHAEAFAARYDDGMRAVKIERVLRFLGDAAGVNILDLGCGVGYFASRTKELGARPVACDFAESMVLRVRQRYGLKFPVVRCSAQRPPFRPACFDWVLVLDLIEHLYDPAQMLRAVHRVLVPGGRLLITTDRPGFRFGRLPASVLRAGEGFLRSVGSNRWLRRGRDKYRTPASTHVQEYTMRELTDLVQPAGFCLTGFDTFPNRAALGPFGSVVESLGRGPLRKYKWDYGIYRFEKCAPDRCRHSAGPVRKSEGAEHVHAGAPKAISAWTLPSLVARTAFAELRTYRPARRTLSAERVRRSLAPSLSQPVFLIGAPRTGTTFLGACLAELPEISYHFEPVMTKAAVRYVYEKRWTEPRARRFFRKVYAWLLRMHLDGDLCFAEKTPRNCFIVPFLLVCFPDARFVHIIRDGRDAAVSLSKQPWLQASQRDSGRFEPGGYSHGPSARFWVESDRREEFESTSDLHRCIWSWRRHTEAALTAASTLPTSQYHELRYESLVIAPHEEGRRLLDFLGIAQARSRAMFDDAVALARPDSVGRGTHELSVEQRQTVEGEAGGLLRRLGYAD